MGFLHDTQAAGKMKKNLGCLHLKQQRGGVALCSIYKLVDIFPKNTNTKVQGILALYSNNRLDEKP